MYGTRYFINSSTLKRFVIIRLPIYFLKFFFSAPHVVTIYFKNVCAEYRIMIRRTCFRRYKQNCTTKTAWIVIAPVIGLLGVSLIPMSLLTVRIDDGTTLYCASENGVVERIMSLVGLPAILTISLATLVLLYLIHNRSKNSNNSASEKEVKI